MEYRSYPGALDNHSGLGTEFLTAEATNALFAVDYRLAVLYDDCLGGADVFAHAAADASLFIEGGAGFEYL